MAAVGDARKRLAANDVRGDVEALAELIVHDTDEPMWSAVVIAKHILDSTWFAAHTAAAEARGAQAVLGAVEAASDGFACGSVIAARVVARNAGAS